MRYLEDKLEVSEQVEEEAGLVGDEEVQQHARVPAHYAQQPQEPSSRVHIQQALQTITCSNYLINNLA